LIGNYNIEDDRLPKDYLKSTNKIKDYHLFLNNEIRITDLNSYFKFRVHYINFKLEFLNSNKLINEEIIINNDVKMMKIYITYKIINGENEIFSNEKIALFISKDILSDEKKFLHILNLRINHLINTKIPYRDFSLFSKLYFLLQYKNDNNDFTTLAGAYFNIFDHNKKVKIGITETNSFFIKYY